MSTLPYLNILIFPAQILSMTTYSFTPTLVDTWVPTILFYLYVKFIIKSLILFRIDNFRSTFFLKALYQMSNSSYDLISLLSPFFVMTSSDFNGITYFVKKCLRHKIIVTNVCDVASFYECRIVVVVVVVAVVVVVVAHRWCRKAWIIWTSCL